ncbi:uncharacterized protein C9orf50 homolog isoform X1 [Antechinus flavipes]|uniref:uncharacterized protein C9orf50 homolog isoform X1 n=1 Tax=Antechinus flavipes TaxID=38775 RepID=UPI0022362C2D|nr:uncharacterized protein C9orf50 homolog isoform X1 [Antechinus flavipes]
MLWGHTNLRVQGSEPEGLSHDRRQNFPAVQVTSNEKRRHLGLIPKFQPVSSRYPDPRKYSYFPRRQEQKTPQGQWGLSPDGDVCLSPNIELGSLTPAGQGSRRNLAVHCLPDFTQQVQQKQENLKSKVLSFWGQVNNFQGGNSAHDFPRTKTWATSEREGPQWSIGWGAKDFPSPVLGELLPNRPNVLREPTEKASRNLLQQSTTAFPSLRPSSSVCRYYPPCCTICSASPEVWSKNRQTVKLKPALISSCSDDTSGPQKRFHPFRVRFADESPKDMALRYWERNYEVQRSLLKSPVPYKSPEVIPGKLGIWMEKIPRNGLQQTNLWRDEFIRPGRMDSIPMSFQDLPTDNLKKSPTYSSLHNSPLANLDFSGTRTFQDQGTDPLKKNPTYSSLHIGTSNGVDFSGTRTFQDQGTDPLKKNPIYNSLHTSTSNSIDFSGTRSFQDLPADSPKKSPTFGNLYNSTLANIDFSNSRPFQDLCIDPAKHTSLYTTPVINTDRPRSRTLNTGVSSLNENSPSLWAPRMDTFVPHLMSSNRKGGQTGPYQFFPPLTPLRTQSTNQGSSESPR